MVALLLIIAGGGMSAFFSGSETGFYRVTRVRLVMDAKSGSWISASLLWLISRSSLVVATVLIGNNIANYLVSLGLVLLSQTLLAGQSGQLQTVLPVLATPLLFIYGELLPKYLYYHAPYFLSTRGAPVMLLFAGLFSPASALVIGLERIWQAVFGLENERSNFSLERQELQRVLMEGQEAGLLLPIQREISQNLFTFGIKPVRRFVIPLRGVPLANENASNEEILAAAALHKQSTVGVISDSEDRLIGCFQVGDVVVCGSKRAMLPICQVESTDSSIEVLTRMQSLQSPMAQVNNDKGEAIGVVHRERLMALLLSDV